MHITSYIWESLKGLASIFIAYSIIDYFYDPFEIIVLSGLIIIYVYVSHGLNANELISLTTTTKQYYQFKELYNLIKYPEDEKDDVKISVFSSEYISKITNELINGNHSLSEDEKELNNLLARKKVNLIIRSISNWVIIIIAFFYIINAII